MRQTILALLVLLGYGLSAQNDSLRKAVENYRGRSNILVPNARQMMIDKLDSGLVEDVRQLYQFLMIELKGSDLQLFYNQERVLLSYYTLDFQPLLNYFAGAKSQAAGGKLFQESHSYYSGYAAWHNDQLYRVLFERSAREFYRLSAAVTAVNHLQADEKEALQLYLRYLLPVTAGAAFRNDSVGHYAKVFLERYPQSASAGFMKYVVLPRVQAPKTRWGLSLAMGGGFINRSLATQFNHQFGAGAGFDMATKKWLFSVNVRAGGNKLAKDVVQNNVVWERGKSATSLSLSLLAGKVLMENRRYLLSPQMGMGYTFYQPNDEDLKQNPALRGISIRSALYPSLSLLALRKARADLAYDNNNESFFFSGLRFNYEWHNYQNYAPGLKGGVFSAAVTVGTLTRFGSNNRAYFW